uniref:Uncharacterized protein n=1 Tax=Ditylenchus dipsaci TaxID=166011 RepID=A0A915DBR3_9BILA
MSDLKNLVNQNNEKLPSVSFFGTKNQSLDSLCTNHSEKQCVPRFVPFDSHILIAPAYKLLACLLPKNMSTILNSMLGNAK